MDWQELAEERVIHAAPDAHGTTPQTVRSAWESVVDARDACLAGRWEQADSAIRKAICVATEGLVAYHGWRLSSACEIETARRIGDQYFGSHLTGPMFEKACMLREMLPLESELDEDRVREVRKSVAASSQYVALVESFTYRP